MKMSTLGEGWDEDFRHMAHYGSICEHYVNQHLHERWGKDPNFAPLLSGAEFKVTPNRFPNYRRLTISQRVRPAFRRVGRDEPSLFSLVEICLDEAIDAVIEEFWKVLKSETAGIIGFLGGEIAEVTCDHDVVVGGLCIVVDIFYGFDPK